MNGLKMYDGLFFNDEVTLNAYKKYDEYCKRKQEKLFHACLGVSDDSDGSEEERMYGNNNTKPHQQVLFSIARHLRDVLKGKYNVLPELSIGCLKWSNVGVYGGTKPPHNHNCDVVVFDDKDEIVTVIEVENNYNLANTNDKLRDIFKNIKDPNFEIIVVHILNGNTNNLKFVKYTYDEKSANFYKKNKDDSYLSSVGIDLSKIIID